MARRKKRTPRRRGRVGGVIPKRYQADTGLMIGVAGGMLLARVVPNVIAKVIPGASPKVTNLIQAGAGVMAAVMAPKLPIVRGVGLGVAAMGAMDLATNLGIIPGADGAVSGREVMIDLDGGMGYGYPRRLVAGNVGATFDGKPFVDSVIAGGTSAMHGAGVFV